MKYTTLLFDTDNTLLDFSASEAAALKDAFTLNGIEFSNERLAVYSAVNDEFWLAYQQGKIPKNEIYVGRFKKTFEKLGITADADKTAECYEENLGKYHFAVEGAVEMCRRLAEKYDICIVTNGKECIQNSRLTDSGIRDIVKHIFISEKVGVPKPEKAFFDYVFGIIEEKDKSKVLIIGDSLSSDIMGGINAGIDTCWYNPDRKTADIKPTYIINRITDLEQILK